jgi:hypothetical protein
MTNDNNTTDDKNRGKEGKERKEAYFLGGIFATALLD